MIQKVCKNTDMQMSGLALFGEDGRDRRSGTADLRVAISTGVAVVTRSRGS
jgi:hypothetical protein